MATRQRRRPPSQRRRPSSGQTSGAPSAAQPQRRRPSLDQTSEASAARPQRRRPRPGQSPGAPSAAQPQRRRPKRRRRRHSGVLIRFLTMIAIVLAVTVGIILFFKINTISVQGNSIYSQQEIIDACALEQGDNLVTISRSAIAGRIIAALPYVEQVRITRILPDTVVIAVKESDVAFAVQDEAGGYWLMNSAGKILEATDAAGASQHPSITGLTAKDPKIAAPFDAEPAETMTVTVQLLQALDGTGLLSKITDINVEKTYDIELWYGEQYQVKLGGSEDLEYKITYLVEVLKKLDEHETGVIDLTFDEKRIARFLPFEAENYQ